MRGIDLEADFAISSVARLNMLALGHRIWEEYGRALPSSLALLLQRILVGLGVSMTL